MKEIKNNYSNEMKNDRKIELEFHRKYDGKFQDYFHDLNDHYLKLNNQEGIISYNQFLLLLVSWEKENKH